MCHLTHVLIICLDLDLDLEQDLDFRGNQEFGTISGDVFNKASIKGWHGILTQKSYCCCEGSTPLG